LAKDLKVPTILIPNLFYGIALAFASLKDKNWNPVSSSNQTSGHVNRKNVCYDEKKW
jgi:hypothetical protein